MRPAGPARPSTATPPATEKRKLTEIRVIYRNEAATGALTGTGGIHDIISVTFPSRRLVYQSYQLAFPQTWLSPTWGTRVTTTMPFTNAGYVQLDGTGTDWFRPSGTASLGTSNSTCRSRPQITDPKGQKQAVTLDVLGRVTKTAVIGKDGEGDTLTDPTTTLTYELDAWRTSGTPASVRTKARETHASGTTRWQEQIAYSDGGGNVVLAKAKAWPGLAPKRDTLGDLVFDVNGDLELEQADPRWIGNRLYQPGHAD